MLLGVGSDCNVGAFFVTLVLRGEDVATPRTAETGEQRFVRHRTPDGDELPATIFADKLDLTALEFLTRHSSPP